MRLRGFTLIELLVVIGIISLLAAVIIGSLNTARESARKAATKAQLRNIRSGIALLESDTGKWPNGCPPANASGNPEVPLSNAQAGLASAPTTSGPATCEWTAADILNWRGPYISVALDQWGSSFYFDPDYTTDGLVRRNCPSNGSNSGAPNKAAVYSAGPNQSGVNAYDCDDIVFLLYEGTFVPTVPP